MRPTMLAGGEHAPSLWRAAIGFVASTILVIAFLLAVAGAKSSGVAVGLEEPRPALRGSIAAG